MYSENFKKLKKFKKVYVIRKTSHVHTSEDLILAVLP